MDADLISL